MDVDQFEERAAIIEFEGGLSRFEAETLAAKAQGMTRWEALNVARRNLEAERHQRSLARQSRQNDMPGVQPAPEEEIRSMPERQQDARGRGVAVPPLRMEGRQQ